MSDATETGDATEPERPGTSVWDAFVGIDPRWYTLAFYLFLLVWMVWLLVVAWEWSWRDKLVPFIAGVPTVALLAVKLVKVGSPETYDWLTSSLRFRRRGTDGSDSESQEFLGALDESRESEERTAELEEAMEEAKGADELTRSPRDQVAYTVRMTAWTVALPLLMYVIGFANALVLFVLGFGLRFYERPRDAVLVTIAFSVFMYLFFYTIIGMQPWTGILDVPSIVEIVGLD